MQWHFLTVTMFGLLAAVYAVSVAVCAVLAAASDDRHG